MTHPPPAPIMLPPRQPAPQHPRRVSAPHPAKPFAPFTPGLTPVTPFNPAPFTSTPFTPTSTAQGHSSISAPFSLGGSRMSASQYQSPFPRPALQLRRTAPEAAQRSSTRGERLANALGRGFVSARLLASRSAMDSLSELHDPMAPERYKALPKHSHASARALIGMAVCKGEKEVGRLEAFRKSGRLSGGADEEEDVGWFGAVVACLAGQEPDVAKAANWRSGENASEFAWRNAVLPLEAYYITRVFGRDLTAGVAPRGEKEARLREDRVVHVMEQRAASVLGANKSVVDSVMDTAMRDHDGQSQRIEAVVNDSGGDAVGMEAEESGAEVAGDGGDGKAGEAVATTQEQLLKDVVDRDVPLPDLDYDPPFPTVDVEIDDIDRAPLEGNQTQGLFASMETQRGSATEQVGEVEQKRKWKLSVWPVHDEVTGKVSIDFDIVPSRKKVWHLAPIQEFAAEVCSDGEGEVVACKVRRDAPAGMLEEMLNDMHNEDMEEPAEIVTIAEGPAEISAQPLANIAKRPRRTKTGVLTVRKKKREQRKAKLKSAIQETLQGAADVKRDVAERGVGVVMNGSAKKRVRVEDRAEPQRRSSRRLKKSMLPVIDVSDDGSGEEDKQDDDEDFEVDGMGGAILTPTKIEKRTTTEAKREPVPAGSKAITSPVKPRELKRARAQMRDSSSPDSPAVDTGQKRRRLENENEGKEGGELWEKSITEVERLIDKERTGSPSDSSEDAKAVKTTQRMPLAQRLLKQVWQGKLCMLETDAFDEHADMADYYEATKNEPDYGAGLPSPGTQHALENGMQTTSRPVTIEEHAVIGDGFMQAAGEAAAAAAAEVATLGDFGRIRAGSEGSRSEYSSGRSDSSQEADYGVAQNDRQVSNAARARELQQRVCGEAIEGMSADSKRKVLKWAEKDFSWFDNGADFMEIVATRQRKECDECGSGLRSASGRRCEETILLKLWTNLSWRKVRRMRHCGRGRKAVEGIGG